MKPYKVIIRSCRPKNEGGVFAADRRRVRFLILDGRAQVVAEKSSLRLAKQIAAELNTISDIPKMEV